MIIMYNVLDFIRDGRINGSLEIGLKKYISQPEWKRRNAAAECEGKYNRYWTQKNTKKECFN